MQLKTEPVVENKTGIWARIVADSISPQSIRITTLLVRMPRCILAEFNTHGVFSRNAASSRAIPVQTLIKRVQEDPFIPVYWGKNKPAEELNEDEKKAAISLWLDDRNRAIDTAEDLRSSLGT